MTKNIRSLSGPASRIAALLFALALNCHVSSNEAHGQPAIQQRTPTPESRMTPAIDLGPETRVRGGALLGLVAGSIVGGALIHFGRDLSVDDSRNAPNPFVKRPDSELDPGSIPVGVIGLFVGALIGDELKVQRQTPVRMELTATPGAPSTISGIRLVIPLNR